MIQVQPALYGLDEDGNEKCQSIKNCIFIELSPKSGCVFAFGPGYNACHEYRDIEVEARLVIQ